MSDAGRILYFPLIIAAAVVLSRRWRGPMRRASRCLAAVNGLALLCIIATGWVHRAGPVAAVHRWLPHALMILDWSVIPFAMGVTLARFRTRPIAAAARAMGLLTLVVVIFLASITGYLGPSYGPIDPMNFRRFQVLHYWAWPSLAIALVRWWYFSPTVVKLEPGAPTGLSCSAAKSPNEPGGTLGSTGITSCESPD